MLPRITQVFFASKDLTFHRNESYETVCAQSNHLCGYTNFIAYLQHCSYFISIT